MGFQMMQTLNICEKVSILADFPKAEDLDSLVFIHRFVHPN